LPSSSNGKQHWKDPLGDRMLRLVASSFAARIRAARDALTRRGERRSGIDRRIRQIPVAIERRLRERRQG
jgi:hypothetical protein